MSNTELDLDEIQRRADAAIEDCPPDEYQCTACVSQADVRPLIAEVKRLREHVIATDAEVDWLQSRLDA